VRLFQSQDQSRGFDKLTHVKLGYFFSIRLSRSDNSGHEFSGLTQCNIPHWRVKIW